MDKPLPEAVVEAVARAICVACEENPDRQGDARGNEFRWQDYRDTAVAAISALAAAQRPAEDGCHCGTCTCNPNMTPAVRFDLSPAQQEGAIREHLIRLGWTPPDEHALSQPAEVEALRAEVERLTLDMGRLQQQYDERTACMIVHRGQALACSDAVRTAYSDECRRADKLAKALRLIESAKDRGFGIDYARGVAHGALLRELLAERDQLAAALEAAREDALRLDALEAMVNESPKKVFLLHHGMLPSDHYQYFGLGLSNTGRTLRQAIDQARGKAGQEVGK